MSCFLDTCEQAARIGGQILLEKWGRIQVREKAPGDLVTQADLESQRAIYQYIREKFPDHDFLGEEDVGTAAPPPGGGTSQVDYRWIVDPLDGTTNYVHGLEGFAVSIGLEHCGQLLAGVVYDPLRDYCYRAAAGEGAWLNGKPLSTSGLSHLSEALLATSFPPRVRRDSPEIAHFVEVMSRCQSVRRMGSAALNFCYVSEGKLDGYWATSNKLWDIAAGVVILREAGGVVSSLEGGPLDLEYPAFVAAATPSLHTELVAALTGTDA
jgi:myo-inositol-1(or 4)-monophosphatase